MQFHHTLKGTKAPTPFVFDEQMLRWMTEDGNHSFEALHRDQRAPAYWDESKRKFLCPEGYLEVAIVDPFGNKAIAKIGIEPDIIYGNRPGFVSLDDEVEKLSQSELEEPDMGYDFMIECILYAMNDGDTYKDEYDCDENGLYEWVIL